MKTYQDSERNCSLEGGELRLGQAWIPAVTGRQDMMGQVLEERYWESRAADQLAVRKGSSWATTVASYTLTTPSAAKDLPALFHRHKSQ